MNILNIKNLNKSFKNVKVLKDLTFSIKKGEIVAVVGPNGIGKTTLMKSIAGLINVDSGLIEINNISIKDNRESYLSKFSCIIETPSLYEILSGYDNINLIRTINNISKDKLNEILSFINIGDKINSKVKTYSLGMKQRLALGIALLTEPELLVLDEPTNGLDPSGSSELRNLLLKLASTKGVSVLISSHILSDLEKICNKIIFIKDGSIISVNYPLPTSEYTNIILTIEKCESIIPYIIKYNLAKEVSQINENTINIKIKTSKLSALLNNLANDNIYYTNIDIIKDTIENYYNNIYRGI